MECERDGAKGKEIAREREREIRRIRAQTKVCRVKQFRRRRGYLNGELPQNDHIIMHVRTYVLYMYIFTARSPSYLRFAFRPVTRPPDARRFLGTRGPRPTAGVALRYAQARLIILYDSVRSAWPIKFGSRASRLRKNTVFRPEPGLIGLHNNTVY